MKPETRPVNHCFSSGPCAKHPKWSLQGVCDASLGRSHRAPGPKAKLAAVIQQSREILGMPEDYLLGIVPGSDTGAFEMAMWSLLGQRGVDVLAWESFGKGWLTDIEKQLRISDVRAFVAEYGRLPDFSQVNCDRDLVFTYNGTTSGVRIPHGDWITEGRQGLTLCDATSAVFAMDIPWRKLDVVTWSWQKVLGGEAAHGMLALSPRAVARLESYTPPWPLPKVFRLTKKGKLLKGVFEGSTINTPSMLAVEDLLDALKWAREVGGLSALIKRSKANLQAIETWVAATDWVDFLAEDPATRSSTSICLKIIDPWFVDLDEDMRTKTAKRIVAILDEEGVAHDIGSYRDAPAGLRIWGGATVQTSDIEALLPWIEWSYGQVKSK